MYGPFSWDSEIGSQACFRRSTLCSPQMNIPKVAFHFRTFFFQVGGGAFISVTVTYIFFFFKKTQNFGSTCGEWATLLSFKLCSTAWVNRIPFFWLRFISLKRWRFPTLTHMTLSAQTNGFLLRIIDIYSAGSNNISGDQDWQWCEWALVSCISGMSGFPWTILSRID